MDKWATLQLQFVDARLQSLPMSDQNSWFHRRGGGGEGVGKGKDADNKQRTESHEEYTEFKCFAFWTTRCFTKRV